jgi:hypothetical protein
VIRYFPDLIQGSEEWYAARCGLLTASEMKLILTPTLKMASNEKERAHLYELLAQRVTKYVDPHYVSDDMLRGQEDEITARLIYAEKYSPVVEMGFITNDEWGFILGFSPDALVDDDGFIEVKSRRQRFQVETIIGCSERDVMPADYVLQVQTGLLVSGRRWCDFISYSGGLPMLTMRVFPDLAVQAAIIEAAAAFEKRLAAKMQEYVEALDSIGRLIPTERRMEQDILV